MIILNHPLIKKLDDIPPTYVALNPEVEGWLLERNMEYSVYTKILYTVGHGKTVKTVRTIWYDGTILEFEDPSYEMLFKLTWL